MTLIDKLAQFCRKYDLVQSRLNDATFAKVLARAYVLERIIVYENVEGEILGYVESWRITFEQLGRLICHDFFDLLKEDIENGPICYLANVAIKPDYRASDVTRYLKDRFFEDNMDADYFIGEALRKRCQPVKVFKNRHKKEVIRHG